MHKPLDYIYEFFSEAMQLYTFSTTDVKPLLGAAKESTGGIIKIDVDVNVNCAIVEVESRWHSSLLVRACLILNRCVCNHPFGLPGTSNVRGEKRKVLVTLQRRWSLPSASDVISCVARCTVTINQVLFI